jgi:hypothetical protein
MTISEFGKYGRRFPLVLSIGCVLLSPALSAQQVTSQTASVRLNALGSEAQILARRVGLWNVTETVWASPGAAPVVTTGFVAERRMIGSLLQEFIRPPDDDAHMDVKRTDVLTYNRLEGRWEYASFDTRAPVGLMPAWSSTSGDGKTIELSFAPFAVPGPGTDAGDQMLRMEQVIRFESDDRDVKDQYFMLADGTGTKWLAHRYVFVRRPYTKMISKIKQTLELGITGYSYD